LKISDLLLWAILFIPGAAMHAQPYAAARPIESVTLSNGILVEHFVKGGGKRPSAQDKVVVHYLARLPDGTVFDSSYARNEPAAFAVKDVIPCWTRGLQQMNEGGAARLGCPAHTAYGRAGVPGKIPPDSAIFFDVELLRVFR